MSVSEFTDWPVDELSHEESLELLRAQELGRLAYRLVDEVFIVPLNYVVDGSRLLFRTGSGSKLLAAALQADVAFEIDWYDQRTAWSVVARGHLRKLGDDEAHRADSLGLTSWLPTPKDDVIELLPEAVTGRRFRLQRP
jgi:uncharacterized protein